MFDVLNTLNPLTWVDKARKAVTGLAKGVKEAFGAKDKSIFERVGILFNSIKKEFEDVKDKKKEVTKETSEALKGDVEAMTGEVKKAFKLEEMELDGPQKEAMDELIAATTGILADPDVKAKNQLSLDKSLGFASALLGSVGELRKAFPDKAEFQKVVDKMYENGSTGGEKLEGLLNEQFLQIFKPKLGVTDYAKLPVLASKFGVEMDDVGDLKDSLSKLDKSSVPVLKKHFFPHTNKDKVEDAVEIIKKVVKKDAPLTKEKIVDLFYLIDVKDFERLSRLLS